MLSGAGGPPALAARDITKRFAGIRALDNASVAVRAGEIHGLLGQNGSGKSTLIRILAGYHAPEPGAALDVGGRAVKLPLRPGEFRELGLSFVHQDLGLVPDLSVAENLWLGELATGWTWRVSRTRERRRARSLLERVGIDVDPATQVASLRPGERVHVAIARAVAELPPGGAGEATGGVLILDEPTSHLPGGETERLFALLRALAARRVGVLLVSHDLDEVLGVTDRLTVLRDGRTVGTFATPALARAELVDLIVGRHVEAPDPRERSAGRGGGIALERLSGGRIQELSLDLRRGEVLGLAGPGGSGFDDVPYLLFGARRARGGRLRLDGSDVDLATITPERAVRAGIALVPADRQRDGSVGSLSVADNLTLPTLDRYSPLRLERGRMLDEAAALLERFRVRPAEPRLAFQALSGGNQQKALLAKWLAAEPALLLLDEPTRGVDVGTRGWVAALIREAASEGAAVVCASTDHEELAAVCDRVLVFAAGRVAHELAGSELTKERIAALSHAVDTERSRSSHR